MLVREIRAVAFDFLKMLSEKSAQPAEWSLRAAASSTARVRSVHGQTCGYLVERVQARGTGAGCSGDQRTGASGEGARV